MDGMESCVSGCRPHSTIHIFLTALSILLFAPAAYTRNTSAHVLLKGALAARLRPRGALWKIAHDGSKGEGNMFDGVTLVEARRMMGARFSDIDSGSCYAFSATEVMAAAMCIASNGTDDVVFRFIG
ncbi:hypothetical protein T484DRAFT_1787597 [Baffinella frigidus]|nr:hypothetical protein T484DRAFT_1787597 [Cryptophyta sp. CCMP2293]